PFVTLTYAQSLDGFIAGPNLAPLTLSSPDSFVLTHALRASHDAILVGVSTVLNDRPSLSTRLVAHGPKGPTDPATHPRPVVLDTTLRCPLSARFMDRSPVLITTCRHDPARREELEGAGAVVVVAAEKADSSGRVDLEDALRLLAAPPLGIRSVMVEGGATVIGAFLDGGPTAVDLVVVTVAPRFVG
ncbi:dihydrofolate reductase-like domain-containing protein, partial [Blyttiomyces helicus]